MEEAHFSAYSIYPGSTKMYHDLKDTYWWNRMKRDIADFMSKCLTCQQVKLEHRDHLDYCSSYLFQSGNRIWLP